MKLWKLLLAFLLGIFVTLASFLVMYPFALGFEEENGLLVSHAAFSRDYQRDEVGLWEKCEKLKQTRGAENKPKTVDEALVEPYCPFDTPVYIEGPSESLDRALSTALSRDTHYKFVPKAECRDGEKCDYIRYSIVFVIPNMALVKIWAPKSFAYEHLVFKFGGVAYSVGARGFTI